MQITRVDLLGSLSNVFYMMGHTVVGVAVSYTINKVAHRVFNLKQDTLASKAIKLFSVIAGTAAGIYFMSTTPLNTFTLRKAGEFLAIDAIIFIAYKFFTGSFFPNFLSIGALVGTIGSAFMFPFSAFSGAYAGAYEIDKPTFDGVNK